MESILVTCQKILRKRAIRKRAERLEINKGELFLLRKNGKQKVKIITEPEEQKRILEACHSDVTSGHFGIMKTCKRLTERLFFYWRGITKQVNHYHTINTGQTAYADEPRGRSTPHKLKQYIHTDNYSLG